MMNIFTIENQTRRIALHPTLIEAEAEPNAEHFDSQEALAELAANWPAARLLGRHQEVHMSDLSFNNDALRLAVGRVLLFWKTCTTL